MLALDELLIAAGALTGREPLLVVCLCGWGAGAVRVERRVEDLLRWLSIAIELAALDAERVSRWELDRFTLREFGRCWVRTV